MRIHCLLAIASCGGMEPIEPKDRSADDVPDGAVSVGAAPVGAEGPEGDPGVSGPEGVQGAPGPSTAYRWVDAVGVAATVGPELTWIDPVTQYAWAINPNSGGFEAQISGLQTTYYSDPYCSSTEYVVAVGPNVPFEYWWGGEYHVRPPDVQSLVVCPATRVQSNVCVSHICFFANRFLDTSTLTATGLMSPPASPFIGPLHLEGG